MVQIAGAQICPDIDLDVRHLVKTPKATKANPSKVISIYLETDLFTRNQLGSNTATEQWLRDIYLGMAEQYGKDGISTSLTGTYWPSNSNENWSNGLTGDIFSLLNTFGLIRQDTPDGRLKHFVSKQGSLIGLGWLGTLQSDYFTFEQPEGFTNHAGPYAVSLGLNDPNYWNKYVLTHEMGHNLGAAHTHRCVWGSGSQVLDQCSPPECAANTSLSPNAEDNTIMSYCDTPLILTNGFGTEPGNLIRNTISQASRDLTDDHCAKIMYLAASIEGDYYATEDVIFHPGLDTDGMCVFIGCP